jgi:hypothetical protein
MDHQNHCVITVIFEIAQEHHTQGRRGPAQENNKPPNARNELEVWRTFHVARKHHTKGTRREEKAKMRMQEADIGP